MKLLPQQDKPGRGSRYLFAGAMLCLLTLQAWGQGIQISGDFQDLPLSTFLETLEKEYPVQFFYDTSATRDLRVTAQFREMALEKCLESVLYKQRLNFHVMKNNRIIIYPGPSLRPLFPDREQFRIVHKEASPEEQDSREALNRKQFEIYNIGIPGGTSTGFATLSGQLSSFETGEPVEGGNIVIPATQQGVISNQDGSFHIRLPVGNHTIQFSSLDMHPSKRTINLYSDGRLDVVLETKYNLLEDVVVIGHGKGNLGEIHIGLEKISIESMKSIPALLGEPDVIKSLITLPGVQTVGEGTSGFNVRGGKTDQNLILIDRAPIHYPSHFFGNFSAINPDIISDAVLYKGSIPVSFGGRISSVLVINTMEDVPVKVSGSGGISPVSARMFVEAPLFSQKSNFLVSYRTTYSNWVLSQIKVPELYKSKVGFYDGQAKLKLWINDRNSLRLNLYKSQDQFQLHSDTVYNFKNNIGSLSWQHQFNAQMNADISLIYSGFGYNISDNSNINTASQLSHDLDQLSLKSHVEHFSSQGLKFEYGVDVDLYSVNPGRREVGEFSNITPIYAENEQAVELSLYAGNEFYLSDRFKVEAGLRLSGFAALHSSTGFVYAPGMPLDVESIVDTVSYDKNSLEQVFIHPEFRLSTNYVLNRLSSVKLSYNKTTQYIHLLSNTTAISPTDTWKLSNTYLLPQIGHQLSAGYFHNFYQGNIETSVEVFYKHMRNIKEYKPGADLLLNDHVETEIINGKGKSYGAEFSLKKPGGRIHGRIDYTYSRTLIRSVSEFAEEIINDGDYFPANYDKPHSLNIQANVKASRRLILSASLYYSTGRPITYPTAKYELGDQVILHYSDYNQYRIPDYFRLDAGLTMNSNLKKNKLFHSTFTFSLYNLTGRKNAYSVYFRSEDGNFEAYKLSIFGAIIPTLSYNFRF